MISIFSNPVGPRCNLVSPVEFPKDKIAIIDDITAVHTKPVGRDYSRFRIKPETELKHLLENTISLFVMKNYSSLLNNGSHKILRYRNFFRLSS